MFNFSKNCQAVPSTLRVFCPSLPGLLYLTFDYHCLGGGDCVSQWWLWFSLSKRLMMCWAFLCVLLLTQSFAHFRTHDVPTVWWLILVVSLSGLRHSREVTEGPSECVSTASWHTGQCPLGALSRVRPHSPGGWLLRWTEVEEEAHAAQALSVFWLLWGEQLCSFLHSLLAQYIATPRAQKRWKQPVRRRPLKQPGTPFLLRVYFPRNFCHGDEKLIGTHMYVMHPMGGACPKPVYVVHSNSSY